MAYIAIYITISYFTANKKDWVTVREIRRIPTSHYDIEEKSWCCEAEYGGQVEELVRKYFPDIPLDIQEHRGKDLYE